MKLKSINPVERHIEKLIVVLAVLFFLYVVWGYVIGSRVQVKLGDREVPPGEVDRVIYERAQALEEELDGQADPNLRGITIPAYAALYKQNLTRPVTPDATQAGVGPDALAWPALAGNRLDIGAGPLAPLGEEKPFRQLDVPTPASVTAEGGLGTLDVNADARIKQIVGQPPFDLPWVSVGGIFDVTRIAQQLRESENERSRPIPVRRINESWAVLDVQVERQRRLADGSWSEPQRLPPMPGFEPVRRAVQTATPNNAEQIVSALRERWRMVLQPDFPPLRDDAGWAPPTITEPNQTATAQPNRDDDGEDASQPPPRVQQLEDQLREIEQTIEADQQRIAAARRDGREPTPGILRRLEQNQAKMRKIGNELDRLRAAMPGRAEGRAGIDMGFLDDPSARPDVQGPNRPSGDRGGPMVVGVLSGERRHVWAHDLRVEPGQTYRYRMRLVTSNPLYNLAGLPKQQAELGEQFTRTTDWSAWSDPVTVPNDNYFFVVGGNQNVGNATVRVWRFYDGTWREAEFNVFPGDPVGEPTSNFKVLGRQGGGAVGSAIDFATGTVAVDVDFDHKLPTEVGGLGGLTQSTIRMLYTDGDRLLARIERDDRQRQNTLRDELHLTDRHAAEMAARREAWQRRQAEQRGQSPGGPGGPGGPVPPGRGGPDRSRSPGPSD
ncbi:MAG: hypothetical protein GVY28_08890, partial [Alphaproteobacteria bacterium]|nr:hypothetical protein [Alphaproteobacteria bacterium]